ncbi:MAG: hypothetical protein OXC11_03525, partial [Rhodospirillales bacterium]|nr:hypothetical protein [Rhodospirillales bacterium]
MFQLALPALLSLALSGCIPAGMELNTPLGGFETSHPPAIMKPADNDICLQTTGAVTISKSATINCGAEPAAPETPATAAPPEPAAQRSALQVIGLPNPAAEHPTLPPAETPAGIPDPLADHIRTVEGDENVAYCDQLGVLHIGHGHKVAITDDEKEALLCADLAAARSEAKRVVV